MATKVDTGRIWSLIHRHGRGDRTLLEEYRRLRAALADHQGEFATYAVGDRVEKYTGDYKLAGEVRAVLTRKRARSATWSSTIPASCTFTATPTCAAPLSREAAMGDLVERLRERAESYRLGGPSAEHTASMLDLAAAELEKLRRERDASRETNRRLHRRLQKWEGIETSFRMSFEGWSRVLFKSDKATIPGHSVDFQSWLREIDKAWANGRAEAAEAKVAEMREALAQINTRSHLDENASDRARAAHWGQEAMRARDIARRALQPGDASQIGGEDG